MQLNYLSNQKRAEWGFLYLLCFSVLNLLLMHSFFIYKGFYVSDLFPPFAGLLIFSSAFLDVSLILILFLFVSLGRLKLSLYGTFLVTLVWSFVNVFYGRFFFQCLTPSSMMQAGSVFDEIVLKSIISGFTYFDLIYLIIPLLYWLTSVKVGEMRINKRKIMFICMIPVLSFATSVATYTSYHFINPKYRTHPELYEANLNQFVLDPFVRIYLLPNNVHAYSGSVRFIIHEISEDLYSQDLTDDEKKEIASLCAVNDLRQTSISQHVDVKNVIFILLESFSSSTSDMIVDGKEITPFLNQLKKDSLTYYRGNLKPNITIGQSGDGQFIYMTGLLPLRSKITVGVAKKHKFIALPQLLKDKYGIKHTEIVIPTSPVVWEQNSMNTVYGIDQCYSAVETGDMKAVDEKAVFSLAMNHDIEDKQPFFQMILGVSTHVPYDERLDDDLTFSNTEFPEEYKNYLSACHYVDTQIERYFDFLKSNHLYNNSLIIIASDHHPLPEAMGMEHFSDELPLYIVNGGVNADLSNKGELGNQLDVYTTILDILHVDSDYYGLGYSLLSPSYHYSVNDNIYKVSESIIQGGYFDKRD